MCTDRSLQAGVMYLFGLEALLTTVSRTHVSAVASLPQTLGCPWIPWQSNQFPFIFSLPCGHWEYILFGCNVVIHVLLHGLPINFSDFGCTLADTCTMMLYPYICPVMHPLLYLHCDTSSLFMHYKASWPLHCDVLLHLHCDSSSLVLALWCILTLALRSAPALVLWCALPYTCTVLPWHLHYDASWHLHSEAPTLILALWCTIHYTCTMMHPDTCTMMHPDTCTQRHPLL